VRCHTLALLLEYRGDHGANLIPVHLKLFGGHLQLDHPEDKQVEHEEVSVEAALLLHAAVLDHEADDHGQLLVEEGIVSGVDQEGDLPVVLVLDFVLVLVEEFHEA